MALRLFDTHLQQYNSTEREHLETVVSTMNPLFGEETGEFIDFTNWNLSSVARLTKVDIIEVKPPKLGHINPSMVTAELTFSVADLQNSMHKKEWHLIPENTILYMVSFDKDVEKKNDMRFGQQMGIKLVRGCTVKKRNESGKKVSPV